MLNLIHCKGSKSIFCRETGKKRKEKQKQAGIRKEERKKWRKEGRMKKRREKEQMRKRRERKQTRAKITKPTLKEILVLKCLHI